MMRPGVLAAAVVVLAADAWVLFSAARNRSRSPTSVMTLTERELRLERAQKDSTALLLRLTFDGAEHRAGYDRRPGWFDRAKLEELGFDCRRPPGEAEAAGRYRAMPRREAFIVLEHGSTGPAEAEGGGAALTPRLAAVDAGLDPRALRRKYPDTRRHLIARGLVRLRVVAEWDRDRRAWKPGAYLSGSIAGLLVNQVNVPRPYRAVLDGLKETSSEYFRTAAAPGPRYEAVVLYGRGYEPFVASCRLLPGGQQ